MEEPIIKFDKSLRQSETKSQNLLYAQFLFPLITEISSSGIASYLFL